MASEKGKPSTKRRFTDVAYSSALGPMIVGGIETLVLHERHALEDALPYFARRELNQRSCESASAQQ